MIKRVAGFRGEGWLALWKGLLTSCVNDALSAALQPLVHSLVQAMLFPSSHQPPIYLPVASHLITGFLLSPLDLVRTRLIIQSLNPQYRTYTGPIDALSQILEQEGGLKGIYLHPHLLLPTLIDSTLRPLMSLALPGLFATYLGAHITEDTNPIAWSFAELMGSSAGLLLTLPFETVRRRLQAQVRGSAKPVKPCVEMRPAPYNGVVDTMWHILTEERSDLPVVRRRLSSGTKGKEKHEEQVDVEGGWYRSTGIGQLYRGLGMRLGASGIVFMLAVFSPTEGDGGWAEL
jgi:fusion and transport protein UGO1